MAKLWSSDAKIFGEIPTAGARVDFGASAQAFSKDGIDVSGNLDPEFTWSDRWDLWHSLPQEAQIAAAVIGGLIAIRIIRSVL